MRCAVSRSTRWSCSSGIGSAHSSQRSPGRGLGRSGMSRIRWRTALSGVGPLTARSGPLRTRLRTRSPGRSGTPGLVPSSDGVATRLIGRLLDVDDHDLGRGFEDGPLDRVLQRDRRRRAAVAAARAGAGARRRHARRCRAARRRRRGLRGTGRTAVEGAARRVRARSSGCSPCTTSRLATSSSADDPLDELPARGARPAPSTRASPAP